MSSVADLERDAIAAFLSGYDEESAAAWERAHLECQRVDDAERAARCAFWLGFGLLLRGETARANGWFARGNRLVEGRLASAARGLLLTPPALLALDAHDHAAALALATEMLDVAGQSGDEDVVAFALLLRGEALVARGDTTAGLAALDEVMVAITTSAVSPITTGIVYCAVIGACVNVFELRRAAEWTHALGRWCDAQPDLVAFRGQCLVHRSQVLQAHGEWPEAASEAARACERLAEPPHPALGIARYQQAELHRLRGEFHDAEVAYREAHHLGCQPMPGLALLRLAQGKVDAALAAVRAAVDETEGLARPMVLAAAVDVLLAAGDLGGARDHADELAKIAADLGAAVLEATAAFATGAVCLAQGDTPCALTALREAASAFRELDLPYEAALAQVLVAQARQTTGDHEAAALELDGAVQTLERLGAQPALARAAVVAARWRQPGDLTERECEVLRLVARGKTNREIGRDLVISEHTVARHLQNVFTKLGLSSRAAATAYAYENSIV